MTKHYRALTADEITALKRQGCTADDWNALQAAEDFDVSRVHSVRFVGSVRIGCTSGKCVCDAAAKPAGLYNAVIVDCDIGDDCRVANVGVHIANYILGDGCCIEDVGVMETHPGARFGNGIDVEVLNEGGGREVTMFNEMSVQYAAMLCLYRYKPSVVAVLKQFAAEYAARVQADRAVIGKGALVRSVDEMVDVCVGEAAVVAGAARLVNGTILSTAEAPTMVGSSVIAKDFIIAESTIVDEGAILSHTYVGQGCRMGKQFSAENCLFFANCEAFHGEGCSIFAGPYTVTHHKSTLLIAGLFSFYNAGSGTNQSNHMYKLGPVHEGKLGRGTKTGSFSYLMWPCRVGPFGVVIGKHSSTFDTDDFPFSHHEARSDGKCRMVPGLNITTVGTVRDGAKWPKRDRRKGSKRDRIVFDVFSPYTVGKMIRGIKQLEALHTATDKSIEEVSVGGALVRRPILRTGQKYYRTGIEMYLLSHFFDRLQEILAKQKTISGKDFTAAPDSVYSERWLDVGGQLMPEARLHALVAKIESRTFDSLTAYNNAMDGILACYDQDVWVWVKETFKSFFEIDLETCQKETLLELTNRYYLVRGKFLRLVLADAEKEFDELSRTGFGVDGSLEDVAADFIAVRGEPQKNSFVKEMQTALLQLEHDVACVKQQLE